MRPARSFRFLRDPLFVAASLAYLAARWLTHSRWGMAYPYLRAHLADSLLIPCAVPVLLWMQHRLGIRDAAPPRGAEIVLYTALWAFLFEFAFPRWWHRGTADSSDVLAYVLGAAVAWLIWSRQALVPASCATPVRR